MVIFYRHKMKVSETLKELRKESGLTQSELAKKLNVGQATIASYENGTREPQIFSLAAYAEFFDCTIDYLIGRTGDFVSKTQKNKTDERLSELIYKFNSLDDAKKMNALAYIDFLRGLD